MGFRFKLAVAVAGWLVLALCAFITACASPPMAPAFSKHAECHLLSTRNAGMGVQVESCELWAFGPSKQQQKAATPRYTP